MADEQLLEGVDIFVKVFPIDGANVDVVSHWKCCISLMSTPNQLRVMLPFILLQKMSGQVVRTHPPKL